MYGKILKPLYDFIHLLAFSEKHKFSDAFNDGVTMNVLTRTTCNNLYLDDFINQLESISKTISKECKQLSKDELLEVVISLDMMKHNLFDGYSYKGIVKSIKGMDLLENEAYKFGAMDYNEITRKETEQVEYFKSIVDCFATTKDNLKSLLLPSDSGEVSKMEWNVGPAILGALMEELELKQWVSPPKYNGSTSIQKYGELGARIFSYSGNSEKSLINAIRDRTLDPFKRESINLPFVKDLM